MNVKGMKGRDFSRVQSWYRLIIGGVQILVTLIELERNDPQALGMTMNVLKSGLISENLEVSILSARLLNKVASTLQDRASKEDSASSLISLLWEWFTQGSAK